MFHSLENYPEKTIFKYDICVIGSGIAAHSFVSKFLTESTKARKRIAVLEGSVYSQGKIHRLESGIEDTPQEQELYQGEIKGWIQKNDPKYLTGSRQRSFGGTTNIWSGWCWPLEPEDLEERDIRPSFSWPLSYNDLNFYYQQAQQYCRLGEYGYENPEKWINEIKYVKLDSMPLDDTSFRTRILHFNPSSLNEYYYDLLRNSTEIDVFNNANCLYLEKSQIKDKTYRVSSAVVRTLENTKPGRIVRFEADCFILATGALETTRLLLLSKINSINPQIGKNFIEHPFLWEAAKFNFGQIPEGIKNFYFSSRPLITSCRMGITPTLVPRHDFIKSEGIGNFRILLGGAAHVPGTLNISWEQMPNLNSTISLSENLPLDIFGQKRIKINNIASEIDKKTVVTIIKSGKELLERLGYGIKFEVPDLGGDPWDWPQPYQIVPGNHPMGTTRMSLSADDGVVDANCRLHYFQNLYVASSSVFPTGGYANSTFTIIAMALRLADHIKENY